MAFPVRFLLLATALAVAASPTAWGQATFQIIDDEFPIFIVEDVSGDGSLVCGSHDKEAAVWTQDDGIVPLGLAAASFAVSRAASEDGSVVVGDGTINGLPSAIRWVNGNPTILPKLDGNDPSVANGVSANGKIIVGRSGSTAVRWNESNGLITVESLPGTDALDVSADGSVVLLKNNFVWFEGGSVVALPGSLPSPTASSLSADGTVAVGQALIGVSTDERAARWTLSNGGSAEFLTFAPSEILTSDATGVSADGSVIVGNSFGPAIIWTNDGRQAIKDLLVEAGLNLENDYLRQARGISDSGRTIVGTGNTLDTGAGIAWIATLPDNSDENPPAVTITAPADDSVLGTTSIALSADVVDDSSTNVLSAPAGIDEALTASGGSATGTVALAQEGANDLTVTAVDDAGNSSSTTITVYRDTTAPVVTVSPPEGTIVSAPLQSFGISVTDQTLTEISVAGNDPVDPAEVQGGEVYGTASALLTGTISLWAEGPNSIVVSATDAAGNTTAVTRTVILDLTAPLIEIISPQNGSCYGVGSATEIPLSANVDDATETEITGDLTGSLEAGGGTLTGTYGLQEGQNVISVTATNPGLDLSGTDTVTVTLDTIAPTVEITSPDADACVSGTVEFHATTTDALPGTVVSSTYSVDGNLLEEAELYSIDTTLLADGEHILRVDAADSCGNTASNSITIRVDNTPPDVILTNPIDLAWVSGDIGFDATASDIGGSGLTSLTMRAAGNAPTTDGSQVYSTPVDSGFATSVVDTAIASGNVDGDVELEVTARDCAGNETTVAITIRVDNTAPGKAITSPADGSTVRCALDVTASVDEPNLASVQLVVDGVESPLMYAPPYTMSFDTRTRLDGEMAITLIATDQAGNVSECTSTVTVDNLQVRVMPKRLQLKSRGKNKSVTARVRGQSTGLMVGLDPAQITLCVPGGSPVPATLIYGHESGWQCDHEHVSGHRGHRKGHKHGSHGKECQVKIKFDRQLLIGSLRGACLTSGKVPVTLKATIDGEVFEIGSDTIRVKGK